MTTLLITNDFPPRTGGIERYCRALVDLLDGDVAVLTSSTPGRESDERRYDAALGVPVRRLGAVLLPTRAVAREAVDLARRTNSTRAIFGAAAPLALLTPALRAAGLGRIVACSHGHEVWWSRIGPTRLALRRIGADVDALTTVSAYAEAAVASSLRPEDRAKLRRLPPPLRLPEAEVAPLAHRPRVVLAVGRLVPRKGFDTLLNAWERLDDAAARLVIVGDGPDRHRLERLRSGLSRPASVTLTGRICDRSLADLYTQARVFALPCRTRAGLEVEGFGYVTAEAQAYGVPVIVGNSGGAPEALRDGETGYVIPTDRGPGPAAEALARRLRTVLDDPGLAADLGRAGSRFVRRFSYDSARTTLLDLLYPDGCDAFHRSDPPVAAVRD